MNEIIYQNNISFSLISLLPYVIHKKRENEVKKQITSQQWKNAIRNWKNIFEDNSQHEHLKDSLHSCERLFLLKNRVNTYDMYFMHVTFINV